MSTPVSRTVAAAAGGMAAGLGLAARRVGIVRHAQNARRVGIVRAVRGARRVGIVGRLGNGGFFGGGPFGNSGRAESVDGGRVAAGFGLVGRLVGIAGLLAALLTVVDVADPVDAQGPSRVVLLWRSDTIAGTYVVRWFTEGGCDPGPGTSGPTGLIVLTETVGARLTKEITVNPSCQYGYVTYYLGDEGVICDAIWPSAGDGPANTDPARQQATLEVVTSRCSGAHTLDVSVAPYPTDDPTAAALNAAAINATQFPVTVTPTTVSVAGGADPAIDLMCRAANGTTRVGGSGNSVGFKLTSTTWLRYVVVKGCNYTVAVSLPRGFVAGDGQPGTAGEAGPTRVPAAPNSLADGASTAVTMRVSIATKVLAVTQTVTGNAGGARANYSLAVNCGTGGGSPPSALPPPAGGGPGRSSVALQTGSYNVTPFLITDLTPRPPASGVPVPALSAAGQPCVATVGVAGVPAACTIDGGNNQSVNLPAAAPRVVLEFEIACPTGGPGGGGGGPGSGGPGSGGPGGGGSGSGGPGGGGNGDMLAPGDGSDGDGPGAPGDMLVPGTPGSGDEVAEECVENLLESEWVLGAGAAGASAGAGAGADDSLAGTATAAEAACPPGTPGTPGSRPGPQPVGDTG